MEANKELTLEFIEDYKAFRLLWQPKHKFYGNKNKRAEAVKVLEEKYNLTNTEVKNKVKSLRSYFAKEHHKVMNKNNGATPYESTWFAYKPLLFLAESERYKEVEGNSPCQNNDTLIDSKIEIIGDSSNDADATTSDFGAETASNSGIEYVQVTENTFKRTNDDRQETFEFVSTKHDDVDDEYNVFGQLIAHKIRKLNTKNRVIAQHKISNFLFQLEIDEINSVPTTTFKFSQTNNDLV